MEAAEARRGSAEELIEVAETAAGLIFAVAEDRSWIEILFDGDLMHTKTVNLPGATLFTLYIEEIPHKTTVYEHPRTTIYFDRPCDLRITREGQRVIITGLTAQDES